MLGGSALWSRGQRRLEPSSQQSIFELEGTPRHFNGTRNLQGLRNGVIGRDFERQLNRRRVCQEQRGTCTRTNRDSYCYLGSSGTLSHFPYMHTHTGNPEADRLSRSPDIHNWMLHPGIFSWLNRRFGPFTVDRFATNLNAQLPRFNTRYWEPGTEGINALAQDWSNENNFANPHGLSSRVLSKR